MVLGHHWRRSSVPWDCLAPFVTAQQQFLSASTHRVRMEPWRAHVCCWGRRVVTISLHILDSRTTEQHFLQLDRSCLERYGWNLSKSKPQSDTSGYCCWPAKTCKKAPNCGCFRPTLLCPEPGVSLMLVESGQSGCRMMLFGFGTLMHLGCSPSLLKELHKASTSTGKKNKPASRVVEVLLPFLLLWVETENEALSKVLECLSQVLNHQKPGWITHFSNCSNQAGNRLQPKTHKF